VSWLKDLYYKFMQSFIWKHILGRITWVDCISFSAMLFGAALGIRKGFLRMLALVLETAAAIVIIFRLFRKTAAVLMLFIPALKEGAAVPAAYVLTAGFVLFLVAVVDAYVGKWFHTKLTGPLKTWGGAAMGAFSALMLWSLASQFFQLTSFTGMKRPYEPGNSHTGSFVRQIVPKTNLLFTHPDRLFGRKKANAV
jgi:uncharacterized membrane protein required for colicin V production